MGRIVIWIVGLALLSMIYVAAIHFKADDIEYELKDRSRLALVNNKISWADVTINGRDAILEGTAPDITSIEKVKDVIMSVWGVRTVECRCEISDQGIRPGSKQFSNQTSEQSSSEQSVASAEPTSNILANENTTKAETQETTKDKDPVTENKVSEPKLQIHNSADRCQKDIDQLMAEGSIEFASGSSKISEKSFSLLKKLVVITQACPTMKIKISGHTDNRGDANKNNILSLDRASAVLDYFHDEGIPVSRLKALGHGESSPIASNKTKEGRKRNRRIEFHIISP